MEQFADAGFVNFDANIIGIRVFDRHCQQRVAHAKADFDNELSCLREYGIDINEFRFILNDMVLPMAFEGFALRICQTAGANNIATNRSFVVCGNQLAASLT